MDTSKSIFFPIIICFPLVFFSSAGYAADTSDNNEIARDNSRIVLSIPRGGAGDGEKFTLGSTPESLQAQAEKRDKNKVVYEQQGW